MSWASRPGLAAIDEENWRFPGVHTRHTCKRYVVIDAGDPRSMGTPERICRVVVMPGAPSLWDGRYWQKMKVGKLTQF